MSIHLNIEGESAHQVLEEMRTLMAALTGSAPVPQTTDTPFAQAKTGEIIDPAPKKTRAKKDKEPETIEGKVEAPLSGASSAEKTESASTSSTTEKSEASASTAASVPDLDEVRAKLKALGATNGLGHAAVFELLGKYGAKNASTVPEDKRAEVIAKIDELIAGVK